MGGGRDRILYPQYLSGVVLGIQEEDCPGPKNTSTPVLYYRVLSVLLPVDDSQNLKVNGEGCAKGESKMLVDVSLEWQL